MGTQTNTRSRAKKATKARGGAAKGSGNGNELHAPRFLVEFVDRGRDLQHEGLRQIENLRGRLQEIPASKRLFEQLEQGNERLFDERERLERWANGKSSQFAELRERLFHQLGLATTRDLDRFARKISTLRRQMREAQRG